MKRTLWPAAAAKLQAVHETWREKPIGLNEALVYNRRLWTIFIDSVIKDDNKLALQVRQNIANIGVFVMGETFSLMTKPKRDHLLSLINVNRGIAASLR